MWICLCRHITSDDIKKAVSKGAKDADGVFAFYDEFPRCGACLSKMEEIMEDLKNKELVENPEFELSSNITLSKDGIQEVYYIPSEEMVDVVSIQHNSLGSGPCIFVLEKDEKGNTKMNKNLLEELNLFVTEDEGDWELTIKRYKMMKFEVDNLPEFRGW